MYCIIYKYRMSIAWRSECERYAVVELCKRTFVTVKSKGIVYRVRGFILSMQLVSHTDFFLQCRVTTSWCCFAYQNLRQYSYRFLELVLSSVCIALYKLLHILVRFYHLYHKPVVLFIIMVEHWMWKPWSLVRNS